MGGCHGRGETGQLGSEGQTDQREGLYRCGRQYTARWYWAHRRAALPAREKHPQMGQALQCPRGGCP